MRKRREFCFCSIPNGLTLDPVQDRAQFSVQRRIDLAPVRSRRQNDLRDQHPQSLGRLRPFFRLVQRFRQPGDLLCIDARSARQQIGLVLADIGQQRRQFLLAVLKRGHLALHALMEHAGLDGFDNAANILLDLGEFRLPCVGA
ncbi:hypothetical protein [Agrobacterium sp. LMR679]|uniref:hypothetical protein n=1 Tax=Agrobacterium sp. LMR679 TaxID=3014335 RepID=UPI0022B01FB1|nr:hypothetical protein [Agrobacterium sp. LMR679]MCZ4072162.1 hypothetical protein [Agrobacterium sp. LMR679]